MYFAENKIDVAVLETGLGGKFDATNVISNPLISVITKIGLDHTAVLGSTLSQIAEEKCGIIKNERVVTSYNQHIDALTVIKKHAPQVIIPQKSALTNVKIDILGNAFLYGGESYKTSLGGDYQIENALIAIETLKNCGLDVGVSHIKAGMKNAFIPARLEAASTNPLIVIDGAHNPDGACALSAALKKYSEVTAIVGVMRDKNYAAVLRTTLPFCKSVICTVPDIPRALNAAELADTAKKYCSNVFGADTLKDAVALAKEKSEGKPIFVFGSLYLASQIRPLLNDE